MRKQEPWSQDKIIIHIGVWMNPDDPWTPQQWHIKSPGMPDVNISADRQYFESERDRRANYYLDQGYLVTYKSTVKQPGDYEP